MYARAPRAAPPALQEPPPHWDMAVGAAGAGAPHAEGLQPLDVQAKELDLALAAEVGLAGVAVLDGGLTFLVSEASQRREALHRLFDETMRRYEARQHLALRQHMRYVSEVLQRRATARQPSEAASRERSPRQERRLPSRKVSPRWSSRSPRKAEASSRKEQEKGNKITRGPNSDRSSSARPLSQREPPAADYVEHFQEFSFGDAPAQLPAQGAPAASPPEPGVAGVAAEGRPRRLPPHASSLKDEICKEVRDVLQVGVQQLVRAQASLARDEARARREADGQALRHVAQLQADMQQSIQMQAEMQRALQVASAQPQLQDRRSISSSALLQAGPMRSESLAATLAAAPTADSGPLRVSSDLVGGRRHSLGSSGTDQERNDWRTWVFGAGHRHHTILALEAKVQRLPRGRFKSVVEWALGALVAAMDVEEPPRIGWLASIVLSCWFECLCLLIITCNCVVTIVVMEEDMRYIREGHSNLDMWNIVWIEASFLLWYVIELSLKLKVHHRFFFTGRDALWNMFDTVLVFVSAIDLATMMFAQLQNSPDIFVELRILRVCKLGRVLRALKAVRFLEDLRIMLDLMVESVISIFWALTMISIVLCMFSLVLMQGVVNHLQDFPADVTALQLFDSVTRCMLTLLLSVTGGVDWIEPYTAITRLGGWYPMLFIVYVLFFILVLLNIVTSVFVDRVMQFAEVSAETLIDERSRLEANDMRELERLFRKVDVDSSGGISLEEFKRCVGTKELGTFLAARGIDVKEATAFFELLSQRTDAGEVQVMDMVRSCARLKGNASSVDLQILRHEINHRYRRIQEVLQCLVAESATANVSLPLVAESVQAPQSQPQPADPFGEQEAPHEGN